MRCFGYRKQCANALTTSQDSIVMRRSPPRQIQKIETARRTRTPPLNGFTKQSRRLADIKLFRRRIGSFYRHSSKPDLKFPAPRRQCPSNGVQSFQNPFFFRKRRRGGRAPSNALYANLGRKRPPAFWSRRRTVGAAYFGARTIGPLPALVFPMRGRESLRPHH